MFGLLPRLLNSLEPVVKKGDAGVISALANLEEHRNE